MFERRTGFRAPVLATSLGRAFLAFCAPTERERAMLLAARSSEPWNALAHDVAAAEAAFAGAVSLPLSSALTDAQVDRVIDAVRDLLTGS